MAAATPGSNDERRELTEEMVFMRTKCNRMDLIRNLNLWGNDLHYIDILRLMPNLEVLSLSVNQVSSLAALRGCQRLSELYLRKNNIYDLAEVQHLASCPQLRVLWLNDNPCATLPNYRDYVLHHLPILSKLDSQDVTEEERRRAAGVHVGDMQTCVSPPPCDLSDADEEMDGGASAMAGACEPPRHDRGNSFGQPRGFDQPEQEPVARSTSLQDSTQPHRGSRASLRGSQDGQPARQGAGYAASYPSERAPTGSGRERQAHGGQQQPMGRGGAGERGGATPGAEAMKPRGHPSGHYPESSPDGTPLAAGSREPSEDCRLRLGSHHNGTSLGARQRQDPRDAWADHADASPPARAGPGHFDDEDLEHQRGQGRRPDEQRASWSSSSAARGGGGGCEARSGELRGDFRGNADPRGDPRSDPRNELAGLRGGQLDREFRDDPRRQPVGSGPGGQIPIDWTAGAGGGGAGSGGQDTGAARADNILCAVLALIKELDGQGLELVRRAIEQRQGEL